MRNRVTRHAGLLVIGSLLVLVAGCVIIPVVPGPLRTESRTIDAGAATSARVVVDLGAGELTMQGGSSGLATMTFIYNVDSRKPTVDYAVSGTRGTLKISQPQGPMVFGTTARYEWGVKLSDSIPIDLRVTTGAAKSELNLRGLSLTAVRIAGGAGELGVDLSGDWNASAKIEISGGVGKIGVLVPSNVGVRVEATTGLGSITATGLTKDGRTWTNAEYGRSAVTLDITVKAGVGEVTLGVK